MKWIFWLVTAVFSSASLETAIAGTPTGTDAVLTGDKARTYFDVGAENGFTPQQWDSFYDEMQGFRYVNGIKVRELPVEDSKFVSATPRLRQSKLRYRN